MNLHAYTAADDLARRAGTHCAGPRGGTRVHQDLGTNGGGFFNVNGAHPFENPTALSNFVEMLAIVMLPAALCYTFGTMTRQPSHGWLLYWVMTCFLHLDSLACTGQKLPVTQHWCVPWRLTLSRQARALGRATPRARRYASVRLGTTLAVVATSNGATGSTAAMPDSLSPLGGGVAFFNMLLGK